jgi:NADPH-dependent 2,4-dienoyl-CoA reductase/sulfur reductase-like enzyme
VGAKSGVKGVHNGTAGLSRDKDGMILAFSNMQKLASLVKASSMKANNVCIIGGGMSGLVSGHACLEAGLSPTIFDSASSLGGM